MEQATSLKNKKQNDKTIISTKKFPIYSITKAFQTTFDTLAALVRLVV